MERSGSRLLVVDNADDNTLCLASLGYYIRLSESESEMNDLVSRRLVSPVSVQWLALTLRNHIV